MTTAPTVNSKAPSVTARSVIPNNPALTLVGGIEWRTADRLIVQTFAPSPANLMRRFSLPGVRLVRRSVTRARLFSLDLGDALR